MGQIDYSAVLNSFPDAVILVDARNCILYANQAVESLLGWRSSDLIGRPLTIMLPGARVESNSSTGGTPGGAQHPRRASAVHERGIDVDVEVTVGRLALEGEELSIVALRLLEDSVETTLDWQHQLTAQHRVMEILTQARTLREGAGAVLAAAGKSLAWDLAALWIVDSESDVLRSAATWQSVSVTASGFAERMRALTLHRGEGLPGQAWRKSDVVTSAKTARDPDSAGDEPTTGPRAVCFPVFASNELVGVLEFFTRDSRAYSDEALATAKTIAGWIGSFLERLHMEEVRARLYHEARDGMRARDELLSVASHELKTPLCGLALRLQTLMIQTKRASHDVVSASEVTTKLEAANRLTQRVLRLMDELLLVTRFTNDRLNLELREVDFSALLCDVTERYRDQLVVDGCSLELKVASGVTGKWDPLQLEQVVTNLLSNAIKYGRGKPIEITLTSDEETATLSVKDHGIGIAAEDQARIFERFERAVSLEHFGGLGLGLWIVRQVVQALGGVIRVHSHPGQGSEFVISIPRTPEQRLIDPAPSAEPPVAGEQGRTAGLAI